MAERKSKDIKNKNRKVTDIIGKPRRVAIRKIGKEEELQEVRMPEVVAFPASEKEPARELTVIDITESEETKEEIADFEQPKDFEGLEDKVEQFEKREVERFKDEEKERRRRRFTLKTYLLFIVLFAALSGIAYAAVEFLPKANIKVVTKKFDWHYTDAVTVTKKISSVDVQNKSLPAEIFIRRKNFTFSFPATGKKAVQNKAAGKIIIYNAYSSERQPLVVGTRFAAPDGKIFRLTKAIVVPAAKITEGKIEASSIEAVIAADKAGAEYNIGPISKFYLPAFKGTPKYEAFYAESKESMTGGFVGDLPYPTDSDIASAKSQAGKSLRDNIDSLLATDISPSFIVIEGSKQFEVLKEEVIKDVDASGNFSVFLDAQSSVVTFREADLLSLMAGLANNDLKQQAPAGGDFEVKNYKAEYGSGRLDLKQGQLSFAVDFGGSFWQPINTPDFRGKAMNKKESDLRSLIYSLPNVERATISFWPFWVGSVPDKSNRVTVEVE